MTATVAPPAPTLRPSDATNLVETCAACSGTGGEPGRFSADGHPPADEPCETCEGRGTMPLETGRRHLSHSRVALFLACQRKYQLHYEARLERTDKGSARPMGRAYQKGIEHGDPDVAYTELMAGALDTTSADELAKLRVQAATVRAAAALYLRTWEPPALEKREFLYLVRLRSPWTGAYSNTFDLKGYADGVTDKGDHLEVIENKLVGQISSTGVRKLALDQQVSLETYGLWRATGKVASEVRYRYVRKPSIKQKQSESVNDYIDRLETDYVERPDFYAHEETLYRSSDDLLRVEAELWAWARQLRDLERAPIYPRNTQSCMDFGGCDFLPICAGEPDARGLYVVRERKEEDTRVH